ncbi:MAG: hypothetical protein RL042_1836 [Nitrospirota bacterium]
MKHFRTHRITAASSRAPDRAASKRNRTEAACAPKQAGRPGEPLEHCYRALLDTTGSAVLLLSPDAIILGWNRAAETLSGWLADETLGRSYVERCLPMEARASFLRELARVTEGSNVREFESPLRTRTGSHTMLSWNISRVQGTRGHRIGLMAIGTAVAPHAQLKKELQVARMKLREEAGRAQMAAEEERRRIARELHDEFGQALTGLKFDLAWFGLKLAQAPAPLPDTDLQGKVLAMSGSVDALLESVRATAAALRPAMLDDLGLVPALESLAMAFQHRTGARCAVDIAPELTSTEFAPAIATTLFRIAQELLTNVMRHAAASQVHIRLYLDHRSVALEVTDNGKGIPRERLTTSDSFGLRGMQERTSLLGGDFHIVGTPGVGTTAIASVPVAECLAP